MGIYKVGRCNNIYLTDDETCYRNEFESYLPNYRNERLESFSVTQHINDTGLKKNKLEKTVTKPRKKQI